MPRFNYRGRYRRNTAMRRYYRSRRRSQAGLSTLYTPTWRTRNEEMARLTAIYWALRYSAMRR